MSGQYGQVPGGPFPGGQPGPGQYPGGQYPGGQYPGGQQSAGQHAPGGDFSAVPAAHQLQVPGQEPPRPPRPPRGGPSTGTWVALGVFAVLAMGGAVTAGVLAGNVSDPTPTAAPTTEDPTTVPTPTATTAPTPTETATVDPTPTATATQEPTSDPTTATDVPAIVDGRMSGEGYSAPVPAGYEVGAWGDGNDGQILNGASQVSVYIWGAADARTRCETETRVLAIWVPGDTAPLTDRQVGGKDAPGNELRGDDGDFYEMRCVLHDDLIYNISLKTTLEVADQASADFAELLDGWVWE